MAKNDFKAFAVDDNANVLSQEDYENLDALISGFHSGIARSEQLNKVWRQSSVIAAMLGDFITTETGDDVTDDGDLNKLLKSWLAALLNYSEKTLDSRYLNVDKNLSDVQNKNSARVNLGLGNVATLNTGTTAGTAAAGNDSRIVNAVQRGGDTMTGDLTLRNLFVNGTGFVEKRGVSATVDGMNSTNGFRIIGNGNLFADIYHSERVGQNHFMAFHVANGGADGWFEFRNDGQFFANNYLHAGEAILATDGNVSGSIWGGWLRDWLLNSNDPTVNAVNRGAIDARLNWYRDGGQLDGRIQWGALLGVANAGAGAVGTYGLLYNQTGHDINPGDVIPGGQLRWASAGERQAWAPSDGAWRALGTANANKGYDGDEVTLYVRIS
ncbi:hypothetical protein [Shimwellia pseudoproteus]|uniref:hypothetical protein n=1 Tax=Shimwellia pseudoproteus TaxID=570012 RepID=UPI0018EB88B0|nr:hypothetical protein [Shimwellia pseudoproteus]